MSKFRVSIRLGGEINDLEAVARVADSFPDRIAYRLLRQGEPEPRHRDSVQPANVLIIPLAAWERGGIYEDDDRDALLADERAQLATAASVVARLAPTLAAVVSARTRAELWVSTIREEEMGGFGLPVDLVAAAAAAGLSISLSILVDWPEDDDGDEDDGDEDDSEEDTSQTT
jgi:hypothetical protein